MMDFEEKTLLLFIGLVFSMFLIGFVLAYPVLDSGIKGTLNEDEFPVYTYNFTGNVTGYSTTNVFSIYSINSTQHTLFTSPDNFTWISIDSVLGIMTLNSTLDNQTGNFTISIQVVDVAEEGTIVSSEFIVNATNDAPNFTTIYNEYNLTQDEEFFAFMNASDEEEHYALFFNVTFNGSCTHADWSGRVVNVDCSLFDFGFNLTNVSDTSASMNFTPGKNDVGTYYANISVRDWGNSTDYGCPHVFCDNATYEQNQTYYYNKIVTFNVFATLEINATDCQNKIFQRVKKEHVR